MRILAGCILIHASEQAYSHMNLIQFPNHYSAQLILLPACIILLVLGTLLLLWGIIEQVRRPNIDK